MKEESKKTQDGPKRVLSDLREGTYSDGHPLDDVHYLECKIILKGDRFTSVENFHDFSRIVRQTAEAAEVDYSTEEFKGLRPQIREVLFADTQDVRLYNNAFILRRRVNYVDGFAVGDPGPHLPASRGAMDKLGDSARAENWRNPESANMRGFLNSLLALDEPGGQLGLGRHLVEHRGFLRSPDNALVEKRLGTQQPALRERIHARQPKWRLVAVVPLIVVHQGPNKVPPHV